MKLPSAWLLIASALTACSPGSVLQAQEGLAIYYDPDTGNVSFDTAGTRSGELYVYALTLNAFETDIRFRNENQVRVFPASFPLSDSDLSIGDATFNSPVSGLFTIGDVLPAGLTQSVWEGLFTPGVTLGGLGPGDPTGELSYTDILGGGSFDVAEFIFGRPDRDFDNRFDLIDPDTLTFAEQATLTYRQGTGEIILDTTGPDSGFITAFLLESDGAFMPEEFNPIVSTPFTQADESVVALFADAIDPGVYSLGRVLPAGLSEAGLADALTSATFIGRVGFGSNLDVDIDAEGQAFALAFVAVPEPTGLPLIVLGFSAVMLRGRKNTSICRG